MKLRFTLVYIFSLAFALAGNEIKPSKVLKNQLIEDYAQLVNETEKLTKHTDFEEINWNETTAQFFKTRLAYKKIELFLAYLDREFIKDHINGAPLPHIERKAPNLVIFEPAGFQRMEEVLFEKDAETFTALNSDFTFKVKELQKLLPTAQISERMIFEAMREELIILAALGITGFDTPSTQNTIAECKAVVQSLEETSKAYFNYLGDKDKAEVDAIFEKAGPYFVDTSFNDFNRFGFIHDFINPLYKKLFELQLALNVETKDLVFKNEFSVNYNATNIFDTDFLNYAYFSKYSNSGDTKAREELGKLLFFDPLMSANNKRACASCHLPEKAFSDGLVTSLAFDAESPLTRNSPGLINSVYNTRLFWDARATTPEEQIEHVLFNENEFNSNYDEVVAKINTCETYLEKFEKAYPHKETHRIKKVSRYTIVASISAYLQSLRSYNSEFDQSIKAEEPKPDNRLVNGFNLFAGKAKCATCHFIPTFAGNVPPLYTDTETEVLGVPTSNDQENALLDADLGRYVNGRPKEKAEFYKHSFKTPTLRNIKLTAPYMHNGVFETLEEVVDFYNVGGGHGWGIAPENTTLPTDSLHLTDQEVKDLIFFIESLTDTVGLTSKPSSLPKSDSTILNNRIVGGLY